MYAALQCDSLQEVEERLQRLGIQYERETVEEHGIRVSQLFIMDPGGSGMIEVFLHILAPPLLSCISSQLCEWHVSQHLISGSRSREYICQLDMVATDGYDGQCLRVY